MNLKNAIIYWIRLPEHDNPLIHGYLGVTKNLDIRIKNHINDIERGKHKNPHLVNAVKKYGWDNLVKDVILSGEEAYCYEIEEEMRPKKAIGWNIAPGGHRGPGWTKGKKKSQESIEKQKLARSPMTEEKRKEKLRKREIRLKERATKRLAKEQQQLERKKLREERKKVRETEEGRREIERERRKQKRILEGGDTITVEKLPRPICKVCNKNYCAANYYRDGVRHYRSKCESCKRKNKQLTAPEPKWKKIGYKKKTACDICGFKRLYDSQLHVFHIDGNLNNNELSNLRTICLNCVETVKKKELPWKRGDLEVDL